MESGFFTWVIQETSKRDWSNNELGRRAGLSSGAISLVLSGQRSITYEFCLAIAKAFGERPETVLRIAGLLPPSAGPAELSLDEAQLIELYRAMTPENRESLLVVAEQFSSRRILEK